MFARFLFKVFFAPVSAWLVMVTLGVAHSFSTFFPALSYQQALVIMLIESALLFWYDPRKIPVFMDILLHVLAAYPMMLILGVLHGAYDWIPALGYWQTAMLALPSAVFILLVSLAMTVFIVSVSSRSALPLTRRSVVSPRHAFVSSRR